MTFEKFFGLIILIIGLIFSIFSIGSIINIIVSYNFPRPQYFTITEILTLYFGEPFSRFANILFLGVVMICGFVLTIFGFTLITLRKFVKILEEKEKK
jgi:uncharacterized membrane protein